MLRQTASAGGTPKERAIAVHTLLRKDLILKRYRAFGEDLALLPKDAEVADKKDDGTPDLTVFKWAGAKEDYECPGLADTARTLAQKPDQLAGLICLAEFFRLNEGLGDFEPVPADGSGGAPSRRADVPRAARGGLAAGAGVDSRGEVTVIVEPTQATHGVMRATDVHKRFGRLEVLKGVSLEVRGGRRSASSAPRARARRPFCVASTISRRSPRAGSRSTGT